MFTVKIHYSCHTGPLQPFSGWPLSFHLFPIVCDEVTDCVHSLWPHRLYNIIFHSAPYVHRDWVKSNNDDVSDDMNNTADDNRCWDYNKPQADNKQWLCSPASVAQKLLMCSFLRRLQRRLNSAPTYFCTLDCSCCNLLSFKVSQPWFLPFVRLN